MGHVAIVRCTATCGVHGKNRLNSPKKNTAFVLYEVCSESTAQGKITLIRITFKTWLFQDFFGPGQGKFGCSVPSGFIFTASLDDPL